MTVRVDKSFERDTNKIFDKSLLKKIADCIDQAERAQSILAIKNIKRIRGGASYYYRIRIGEYRIGIIVISTTVIFIRFLHRKDIYKYFP